MVLFEVVWRKPVRLAEIAQAVSKAAWQRAVTSNMAVDAYVRSAGCQPTVRGSLLR